MTFVLVMWPVSEFLVGKLGRARRMEELGQPSICRKPNPHPGAGEERSGDAAGRVCTLGLDAGSSVPPAAAALSAREEQLSAEPADWLLCWQWELWDAALSAGRLATSSLPVGDPQHKPQTPAGPSPAPSDAVGGHVWELPLPHSRALLKFVAGVLRELFDFMHACSSRKVAFVSRVGPGGEELLG